MGSDHGRISRPRSPYLQQSLTIHFDELKCPMALRRSPLPWRCPMEWVLNSLNITTALPRCQKYPSWTTFSLTLSLTTPKLERNTKFPKLSLPPCPQPCTSFSPSALAENSQCWHFLSEGHINSKASLRRRSFSGLACGASRHHSCNPSSSTQNARHGLAEHIGRSQQPPCSCSLVAKCHIRSPVHLSLPKSKTRYVHKNANLDRMCKLSNKLSEIYPQSSPTRSFLY